MRTRPYVFTAFITFALLVQPAWGQEVSADAPSTDLAPVDQDTAVSAEPELISPMKIFGIFCATSPTFLN